MFIVDMKTTRILSIFALLALATLFGSCRNDSVPAGVMDAPTMTAFLKEAYLLEGFYAIETEFRYDSLHAEMMASYDSLLDRYGLTREDFERSIEYYSRHPRAYQVIHEQVVADLDSILAADGGR